MTKKELIENLKNVPDDAVILAVDCWKNGIRYGAYWGSDTEYSFILDIMEGAKYVPLSSNFKLSDYKKYESKSATSRRKISTNN